MLSPVRYKNPSCKSLDSLMPVITVFLGLYPEGMWVQDAIHSDTLDHVPLSSCLAFPKYHSLTNLLPAVWILVCNSVVPQILCLFSLADTAIFLSFLVYSPSIPVSLNCCCSLPSSIKSI